MTKRAARTARKQAWMVALSEGRILKTTDNLTMIAYPTIAAANAALATASGLLVRVSA